MKEKSLEDIVPEIKQNMIGWNACKNRILEILKKPLINLDLSEDYCDERYIEEIEKL